MIKILAKTINWFSRKSVKLFVILALTLISSTVFAQTGLNIKIFDYKDVSPGVVGNLQVITETVSEDIGRIVITGSLKYEFPPQPKYITIGIKNIDGKGVFKDFAISGKSEVLNNIDIVFENIPIDKSSKTKTSATKDRFLITSTVDKGVDFFFPGNSTYIYFDAFDPPPAGPATTQTASDAPAPYPTGKARTSSIIVTASAPAGTNKAKVDFAALTLLPINTFTPAFIGFDVFNEKDVLVDHLTDTWKEIEDVDAPRADGTVLGASKHSFTVEKGKVYTVKTWLSKNITIRPNEGEYLGSFLINADYVFGKPVTNTAPGLKRVDQGSLDSIWNSITGTFNPGDIEFIKIGSGTMTGTGSDKAYIFLSKIPGLENTTAKGVDGKMYPAFDPTVSGAFSKYISIIINMVYGLIALLAVFNIIHYGFNLMVSSATPFKRSENKAMIWNSFIALGIALGSYLLLNTINPKLTSWNMNIAQISVPGATLDFEAAMEEEVKGNPTATTNLTAYLLAGTFTNPKPSNAGVKTCADKLASGKKVTKLEVTAVAPSSSGNKMDIYTSDGLCATVPINIGAGGTTVWPKSELKKTPKGANGPEKGGKSITVGSRSRLPKSNMEPAICTGPNNKKFNCGAAFIETGILNEKGEMRYIGIHGQGNNELKPTAGCIRMKNDDLVLLAKYFIGVDIYIK